MEFDPFTEFTSEQEARLPAVPNATPPLRPTFAASTEHLGSGRSFVIAVLFVAATTPWILLTRGRLESQGGVSPSVVATRTASTAGMEMNASTRTSTGDAAPQRPLGRADDARITPSARRAGKGATSPHLARRPSAANPSPASGDVVHVSEREIVGSVVLDGPATNATEAQSHAESATDSKRVDVSAEASDPDGDVMTFRWSAPEGSFADPAAAHTTFTCPTAPGVVPVTVAVTDARGAVARDTITVNCVAKQ